jgi:hypothetical protein
MAVPKQQHLHLFFATYSAILIDSAKDVSVLPTRTGTFFSTCSNVRVNSCHSIVALDSYNLIIFSNISEVPWPGRNGTTFTSPPFSITVSAPTIVSVE